MAANVSARPAASHHELHPPRGLLIACATLVVLAILGVSIVRLTGSHHSSDWRSQSASHVSFRFADGTDGSILALDAVTGEPVYTWPAEAGGFVRTSLRSMAISRSKEGFGAWPSFTLHRTFNGKMILEDPVTGQWISLDAFGKDNVAQFSKLLGMEPDDK
jgi:putative photosynthetic complex assembly protein